MKRPLWNPRYVASGCFDLASGDACAARPPGPASAYSHNRVLFAISDDEYARRGDRHGSRLVEPTRQRPKLDPDLSGHADKRGYAPIGNHELAKGRVAGVGNVQVARAVRCDSIGEIELSGNTGAIGA